jgi:hypothetical protein
MMVGVAEMEEIQVVKQMTRQITKSAKSTLAFEDSPRTIDQDKLLQ